ncbi:response regulator transcription factor [Arthrobacter rhizosphaerae]|uniref:response regulator transcription factor n=1 Tax=Arthrobacter rhizosphaerae TaxID=2855490 RepID=UPI001FF457C4|nr:response regulator [Arthrobacter rhizosphaerae]
MWYTRTAVVIEDDADIGNLVCGVLKISGLSLVRLTETGAKGVAAVQKLAPGIVILDYGLPDINGFEVIRQIRTFSCEPILMLTGRVELADKLLAAGANGVIPKPFRMAALRVRVEELLRPQQGEPKRAPSPRVPVPTL